MTEMEQNVREVIKQFLDMKGFRAISIIIEEKTAPTQQQRDFEIEVKMDWHRKYGLTVSDYKREITIPRLGKCEITGIKPKNHKYPIIVYCLSKRKTYKCSVEQLKAYMKKNPVSVKKV
jgi:hypothetical protein